MDASAIERFSGPPLAERAYISEQARACVVRPGTEELEVLVTRDLAGGHGQALAWDAWRRADGRWTVVASVDDSTPLSTWVFDPRSRSVQPDDASSHRLASQDVVVPLRSSTSTAALPRTEAPAATTADDNSESDDAAASSAPASEAVDSDAREDAKGQPSAPEPEPATARPKSRKGRRASVPRWDEILFGAGQSDS